MTIDIINDPIPPTVLAAFPRDCRPSSYLRCIGGGFSDSKLWRCSTPRGELALRAWPEEYDRRRLAWVHCFQTFLASICPIPVAAPIPTLHGETAFFFANRVWDLARWLPGCSLPARDWTPELQSKALAALAEVHLAAARFEPERERHGIAPAVVRRLAEWERLKSADFSAWPRALADRGWAELAELAIGWIDAAKPHLANMDRQLSMASRWPVPLQACLRDVWSDHLLMERGRISGLIDFGAAGWDSVACDLSRLLRSVASHHWTESLAAYEEVRPLNEDERRMIQILDAAAVVMTPTVWFRWIADENREFQDRAAVTLRVSQMVELLRSWRP